MKAGLREDILAKRSILFLGKGEGVYLYPTFLGLFHQVNRIWDIGSLGH